MTAEKTKRRTWMLAMSILLLLGGVEFAFAEKVELSDPQISSAVDRALVKDSATPADDISVTTAEGIVTLEGRVDNVLARDRAEVLAATVRGVRGIVNRIDVAAPYRPDTAIEEDVEQALIWDPATEAWEISTSVKDGVVTLGGRVNSWYEKDLAGKVVKGVKGVRKVNNDITVDYVAVRSEAEIQEEIRKTFRWDAYLDDTLIDIAVEDGRVTLTGTVGSLAEKSRAGIAAWVPGVESVNDSALRIDMWTRNDRLRQDKFMTKPDADIAAAVRDTFFYDPRIDMTALTVDVDDGIATLRGTVDDLKEKRAAEQDAQNVIGVRSVKNLIKVRPDTPLSDNRIENNVRAALLRDPYVDRYRISVSVMNGVVYLYGEVDSKYEKGLADDLASRQKGVRGVKNFLRVRGIVRVTYNPYVDDWNIHHYDWYGTSGSSAPARSDWEIEREIRDELFWSPFVDANEVKVAVDGGVATLTGTVDTWYEREAAAENALEGGAVFVENELAVAYGTDDDKPTAHP